MPDLDHSKATAKISVTGLALSCYNEATRNWEVGFIKADRHVLRITVAKVLADQSVSQITFEVDLKHRIFVTAANPEVPAEPLFMREPFDRKNRAISHDEDIRWIVDLEKEFNEGKPIEFMSDVSITELFVAYPTLYAGPDNVLPNMKLVKLTSPPEESNFGTVSDVCHADITCNEGGAVIFRVEGPLGFSIVLPHIPGQTHEIVFENHCPAATDNASANGHPQGAVATAESPENAANGSQPTDFSLYFNFVKVGEAEGDGLKFDLKSPAEEHGSDAVCNPVILGSRTSLLPVG